MLNVSLPDPWGAQRALAAEQDTRWFYRLLVKSGVSPSVAETVVDLVIRPLELVIVIVIGIVVAYVGAHLIRNHLSKVAQRAANRSDSVRASARAATMMALIANLWRVFVLVVVVIILLGMLGINLTPLLASATVIGATIGFGAQTLVRDYLSGFLLTFEDQFGIGDSVEVIGISGVVEDISLRVTRVRGADGTLWYVPNGEIRKLANTSRGWAKAVVDVPVQPTDAAGLTQAKAQVEAAAKELVSKHPYDRWVTSAPEIVGITQTDADACTLRVVVATHHGHRDAMERALREAAIAALVGADAWPKGAEAPAPS
jgi:moderate conductance mechanosensitive channel